MGFVCSCGKVHWKLSVCLFFLKASRSELILMSYSKKFKAVWLRAWFPILLSFLSQDCGCWGKVPSQRKKAAEIPWAISLMWSIMWSNKLPLQFLWNQWNEWCLKWICSWWNSWRRTAVFWCSWSVVHFWKLVFKVVQCKDAEKELAGSGWQIRD